jgi:hypothetical protein
MLKDEMKLLVQLAAEYLSGVHKEKSANAAFQKEQQNRIEAECQRIKRAWTILLFSQTKNDIIKRYIGFQQQLIQESADDLYRRLGKSEVCISPDNHASEMLIRFLLDQLVQLKDFQIQYFNSYINEEGKVLDVATPPLRKYMAELADELGAGLKVAAMDGQLKTVILDYLDLISIKEPTAPITYQAAGYLINFMESLSGTIDSDDRDLTDTVTEGLFYLNFNYNRFCQWYRERILKRKELLLPREQLPMLLMEQLTLKSMQVVSAIGYNTQGLPVNILLEGWLDELIRQGKQQNVKSDDDTPDKMELKLTVAQLALLIRLLYEEDVFAMKNIAALLRFFAAHFMSKKQERISYGSMNKLYYTGDQFTGSAVRELLLKMIAKINKMFFPS